MEKLDQYIEAMSSPQTELLHELERETYLRVINPRMISGHIQGKLLEMLVRMLRPRRILEIGTFTGYSAISMAMGLEEGAYIDTFEVDDELEMIAADFFERSGVGDKIRQHIGSALDLAPQLVRSTTLYLSMATRGNIEPTTICSSNITSYIATRLSWRIISYGTVRLSRRLPARISRRRRLSPLTNMC